MLQREDGQCKKQLIEMQKRFRDIQQPRIREEMACSIFRFVYGENRTADMAYKPGAKQRSAPF